MAATDHPPADTPEEALSRYRESLDPRDLGRLFDLTAADLFRVALHLCPDAAAAEDALQETFLAVMEHPDRYEPGRPARPWLAAILRHHASKVRRAGGRVPDPARLPGPKDPADPLLLAADAEERERVRVALLDLEEPYREAALLRWRYGLEPAEIAEVKGVPPGTVSSWLHRAVEKLRVEMGALPAALAVAFPEKGLTVVKAQVLKSAAAKAVAAGTGAVALAAAGGGIVTGKVVVAVAAVCVASVLGWWTLGGGGPTAPAAGSPPAGVAAASGPGTTAPGKGAGTAPEGPPTPAGTSTADPPAPGRNPPTAPAPGAPTTVAGDEPGGASSSPGKEPPGPKTGDPSAVSKTPPAYSPSLATATLRFRAKASGTLPRMRNIKFDADPKCGEQHSQGVPEQTVVADAEGNLANVIAWVSRGSDRWTYTPATEPVVLDQKGCMYIPHVLTVMVNQPIAIRNSDPVCHNIHAVPKVNAEFNKSQLKGAQILTERFSREEVAVKMKCDIHGWMGAWAGVFAHPFHGVTGADGSVSIKVPPGEYEVSGWHEYPKWSVKPAPRTVTVGEGETKEVDLGFEAR